MDQVYQPLDSDPFLEVSLETFKTLRINQLKEELDWANRYLPSRPNQAENRPDDAVIVGHRQVEPCEEYRHPGLKLMAEDAREQIKRIDFNQNPKIPKPDKEEFYHAT
jgi:hypothetical protein